LFTFISMFGVNVKLAAIALILTPISSYTCWTIGRRVNRQFEQLQAQFGDLSAKAQENFSGIRVVKAFSQEEPEIRAFAVVNRDYLNKAVDLAKVNGLVWPTMQFILGGALLAILWIGGQDAIEGRLTIGQLIQFIANLMRRLFDAQQGEIRIDGSDVRRYPLPLLRRAVGYVPQETCLFSVPLRENVGFGNERALTDAELEWAGEVSQLGKDVADFP